MMHDAMQLKCMDNRVGRKTLFSRDRLGTLREFSLGIDIYYPRVSARSDDVSPGQ